MDKLGKKSDFDPKTENGQLLGTSGDAMNHIEVLETINACILPSLF